jgi:hypothetical protein
VAAGVEDKVLIESVDDALPPIEAGLKLAVAPAGKPLVPSETLPVKPLRAAVETA